MGEWDRENMIKYQLEKNDFLFAAFAGLIVIAINIITFIIALLGGWSNEIMLYPVRSMLIQPLIWGTFVLISIPFLKRIPYYWKLPFFRVLLWTPIIILDIWMRTRDSNFAAEYPSYFLYLNNEGLLPFTNILSHIGDSWENEPIRISYMYFMYLIGFAIIQAGILRIAFSIAKKFEIRD